MKIERINENQIRCTLNKADLVDRNLRLTELAYGTDKAKQLFQDMMQQASYELGFEAEDIPLMIEAIPVSPDSLILVITKVEDPGELDTRFSKFSKPLSMTMDQEEDEDSLEFEDSDEDEGATSILNLLNEIDSELEGIGKGKSSSNPKDEASAYRVFMFGTFDHVISAAKAVAPLYCGKSSLYQNPHNKNYYLVLYRSDMETESYSYLCNLLREYAYREQGTYASLSYMEEHFKKPLTDTAISSLANL